MCYYTKLTAQDKEGTHEQLSQNKKVVDHPCNDTVSTWSGHGDVEGRHFYEFNYFDLWTICKHLLCEMDYLGHF